MSDTADRTDSDTDVSRTGISIDTPSRRFGMRITREQIAAAERARDYHLKRVLKAVGDSPNADPESRIEG